MESLPKPSQGWTKADRDKFFNTFGAVLDFCIPIRTVAKCPQTGDQE